MVINVFGVTQEHERRVTGIYHKKICVEPEQLKVESSAYEEDMALKTEYGGPRIDPCGTTVVMDNESEMCDPILVFVS